MDSMTKNMLVKFTSGVEALKSAPGYTEPTANTKPYELTSAQFIASHKDQIVDRIIDGHIDYIEDPISELKTEHERQLLKALKDRLNIPVQVLLEYRYRPRFFKKIRWHCNKQAIDLDE